MQVTAGFPDLYTYRGWTSAESIKESIGTWGIKWRRFWCAQPWRQQHPLRVSPHCDTSDYAGKSWRPSSPSLQCSAQVGCLTLYCCQVLVSTPCSSRHLPFWKTLPSSYHAAALSDTRLLVSLTVLQSSILGLHVVPNTTAVLLCLSITPYFLEFSCQPSESAGKYVVLITALQSLQPFVKKVGYW